MDTLEKQPHRNTFATEELVRELGLDVGPANRSTSAQPHSQQLVVDVTANTVIPEGSRNPALASLAGTLRRRGLNADAIFDVLKKQNAAACVPPLPEAEVERIARSVGRYDPDLGESILPTLTDTGNGDRFARDWQDQVRYVPELRKWLIWDGARWKVDDSALVMELAKTSARRIYEEGAAISDDAVRVGVAKHGFRSLHLSRLEAMTDLAKSIPALVVHASELDADPMLLGVKNGVLDLRIGTLRAPERSDLMTKQAPVSFDPEAKCPSFERFLSEVMGGNKNLLEYMQRVMGYSLTGKTIEQCLLFCHGSGANGKTTLLNVFKDLLGPDYCKQTDSETLMAKYNGRGASNDLARLHGARVVLSNEVEEGSRLSEALIKQMTGGDPIAARFLYAEHFEFVPQFKLLIAGNHQPVIRGDDTGIWRRLQLVPFTVTIPSEKRDPELQAKLRAELPGILNFALAGCLAWQKTGLLAPAEVTDAVKEYRSEMDVLGQWITDNCEVGATFEMPAALGYNDYKDWAQHNGFYQMTSQALGRRLKERFTRRKTQQGRIYVGLKLRK